MDGSNIFYAKQDEDKNFKAKIYSVFYEYRLDLLLLPLDFCSSLNSLFGCFVIAAHI